MKTLFNRLKNLFRKKDRYRVICPLCDGVMEYRTKKYDNVATSIWVCSGDTCPAVLFEYFSETNSIAVHCHLNIK